MSNILPFYLVCDESYSMAGDPIDAMNEALPDLHQAIGVDPVLCDKTRFSIVTFSDTAQVLQSLVDLSQITQLPQLKEDGGTGYAAVFRLLRGEIDTDIDALKAEGHRVFRPTIFFISDGQPTDSPDEKWLEPFRDLVDPGWHRHPNIIAFGLGEANEDVIRHVGVTQAFMSDGTMTPGGAIKEFAKSLIKSIVVSGQGGGDTPVPVIPTKVPGFKTLSDDSDEEM